MSIEIIKERGTETEVWWEHNFRWPHIPAWAGYSFVVDEKGNFIKDPIYDNAEADRNYRLCKAGKMLDDGVAIVDEGIERKTRSYHTNAIGRCKCGKEIELYDAYMGACECPKCGQWYNMFGQELVSPEYWDEVETVDYDY